MNYLEGYKFIVSSHEEILKNGWVLGLGDTSYSHEGFPKCVILTSMITRCQGQTLTVDFETNKHWYMVKENNWEWPVGTFLAGKISEPDHKCVEGMTPLDGWFICKICGTNLEEIK